MKTHPQLQNATPARYNDRYGRENVESTRGINPAQTVRENIEAQLKSLELLSEGMAGMVHAKEIEIARTLLDVELPDDPAKAVPMWYGIVQENIYRQLSARGEPLPNLNQVAVSHPVGSVEFIFPNYFLLSSFSSMSSYRIRPLGPESCIFELWSLTFFPEGKEPEPPMEPLMLPYDSKKFPPIPQQDYSNIPQQQRGLHAKGFESMRLAHNVEGLISNYQRVIDGYLSNEDPKKLAKASQMLGGNFDGKILDLGL
jgi:carnitine monooxygenase subunit